MAEKDNKSKSTLKIGPSKLSLTKTVEGGKVTQNFQRGRSKTVTVEVRKTRNYSRDGGEMKRDAAANAQQGLSAREQEARMKALKLAEEAKKTEGDKKNNKPPVQTSVKVKEKKSPEADVIQPEKSIVEPAQSRKKPEPKAAAPQKKVDDKKGGKGDRSNKMKLGSDVRRGGKMTVQQALNYGDGRRQRSLASVKRAREKAKRAELGEHDEPREKRIRDVVVPEAITVQELANRMAERAVDVVKELMKMGSMVTVNQTIDQDTAELIVEEFGHRIKRVSESDVENVLVQQEEDKPEDLKSRPPVVTVMGHVDHGKTSLLDALRKTDVAAGEAGGITQHIGAYQVQMESGDKITFLDTPGHEAFTAMRSRGAQATDIVILVVAADDGLMPQTEEAIAHSKAAEVPIIVAINKMDKEGADPAKVKNELMQHELIAEEFGGDTMVVEVSALKGTNLDKLEEAILLTSEISEFKANPDRAASGVVVESKIEQGRGTVATVLVRNGTLKVGDIMVAGSSYGKVRAMIDDKGNQVKEAGPAVPVEILGLNEPPEAGDEMAAVEDEKTARDITEYRTQRDKNLKVAGAAQSMEQLFATASNSDLKELPVILKTDVQGSAEAIAGSLAKMDNTEVTTRVIHSAVGGISESDVSLAQTTGASIIAFNVRANKQAKEMADKEGIEIRYYSIIYDVVDDIKALMSGLLSPKKQENFIGYAEILEVFNVSKVGKVAGCKITDGVVKRGAGVRLLRDDVVIHEGTLKTLKRFKDEVKEVKNGFECGMAFEKYDDIKAGDVIEAFEIEEVTRTVDDVAKDDAKSAKSKASAESEEA